MTAAEKVEIKGAAAFMRGLAEVLTALVEYDSRHEYAARICAVAARLAYRADALDALAKGAGDD